MSHRVAVSALFLLAIALLPGCGPQPTATPTAPATALAPPSPPPPGPPAPPPAPPSPTSPVVDLAANPPMAPANPPSSVPTDTTPSARSFTTPEEVFDAAKTARSNKDIDALMACYTKEGFDYEVGAAAMGIAGGSEFMPEPMKSRCSAAVAKYKIPPLESMQKQVTAAMFDPSLMPRVYQDFGEKIISKKEVLYEALLVTEELKSKIPKEANIRMEYLLLNVTVMGDKAEGRYKLSEQQDKEANPIYFVKQNNSWMIDGYPIGPPPLPKLEAQAPIEKPNLYFDRPEQAYRAMRKGRFENDFDAMFSCCTEEAMYHELGVLARIATGISYPDEQQVRDIAAAVQEAGINPAVPAEIAKRSDNHFGEEFYESMVELGRSIKNPRKFFDAVRTVLTKRTPDGDFYFPFDAEPRIQNLYVDGNRATMKLLSIQSGIEYPIEVMLIKSEQGWQVSNRPSFKVTAPEVEVVDEGSHYPWGSYQVRLEGKPIEDADHIFLLLHGAGASKDDLADVATLLAAEHSIAVAMLQGKYKLGEGRFSFVGGDEESVERRFRSTLKELSVIIFELKLKYPQKKISIGGFSQGGMIALNLVDNLKEPHLHRMVLLSTPPSLLSSHSFTPPRFPILFVLGNDDPKVTYENTIATGAILKKQGYPLRLIKFEGGHEIPRDKIDEIRAFLVEE